MLKDTQLHSIIMTVKHWSSDISGALLCALRTNTVVQTLQIRAHMGDLKNHNISSIEWMF